MHPPVDICIVTQLHPSSNPRVVKEADALTDAGYTVAVIAPNFSAWGLEADKEFAGRAWKIVERPQFGPLSPRPTRFFELARRALAGTLARKFGVEHPAVVLAAWHPVAPLLVSATKQQPASLYIGHLAGLPAAAIAAAHHGSKYAFDAEDFHPGDLPDTPENAPQNRMIRLIERWYLRGCAYITAASPGIAEAYVAEYGIAKPTVILNTFPKTRSATAASAAGSAKPSPSVYWFSQTIGAGRGIECAIEGAALAAARPHLYLRGTLAAGFGSQLTATAQSTGMTDRLHILSLASPLRMEALAAEYDVGYSGETGFSPNNNIALGNKLFSYLLAGLPILMSDSTAHQALALELPLAARLFRTNDPVSLAGAMDTLLLDNKALALARKVAWEFGQRRFNWGVDAERLIATVRRVIKPFAPDRADAAAQLCETRL